MKKYLGILVVTLTATSSFAQKINESQVPTVVKQAFAKAYPNSKSIKWDRENEDWEASFTKSKTEMSVVIDNGGNIKEVESEIGENQLPAPIKKSFNTEFIHYKIKEASKIVAGTVTTYEIEAAKGKEKFEFIYNINGKLLSKKEIKKDEEEKD